MSDAEADRIARRIRRLEANLRATPDPITVEDIDGALAYARNVNAPLWLVRLLERARREYADEH